MRVLLTRPAEDSARTAARLASLGHEAVIAPVMRIVPVEVGPMPVADALVLTSARAVPAVAQWPKDVPCFCVGARTAQAARDAGFSRVVAAGGDGAALIALLTAEVPQGARLVHASGADQAQDYGALLRAAGFVYEAVLAYRAEATEAFPPEALTALRDGRVEAVLHYSPRSARLLFALARLQGAPVQDLAHLCLSPAVAEAAQAEGARQVRIAPRADEDALFALLT